MVLLRISLWLDNSLPVYPNLALQNPPSFDHFLFILPSQALSSLVRILLFVVKGHLQGLSLKNSSDQLSRSADHRFNDLGRVVLTCTCVPGFNSRFYSRSQYAR